jgi:hypothetical protein
MSNKKNKPTNKSIKKPDPQPPAKLIKVQNSKVNKKKPDPQPPAKLKSHQAEKKENESK